MLHWLHDLLLVHTGVELRISPMHACTKGGQGALPHNGEVTLAKPPSATILPTLPQDVLNVASVSYYSKITDYIHEIHYYMYKLAF